MAGRGGAVVYAPGDRRQLPGAARRRWAV